MSLSEAEAWAQRHSGSGTEAHNLTFSYATIDKQAEGDGGVKLSQPRAYSLALAPHVVHAQSSLLGALVSSRLHKDRKSVV